MHKLVILPVVHFMCVSRINLITGHLILVKWMWYEAYYSFLPAKFLFYFRLQTSITYTNTKLIDKLSTLNIYILMFCRRFLLAYLTELMKLYQLDFNKKKKRKKLNIILRQ